VVGGTAGGGVSGVGGVALTPPPAGGTAPSLRGVPAHRLGEGKLAQAAFAEEAVEPLGFVWGEVGRGGRLAVVNT
jgi:hypothetical protein